jgi:hypothetical protein
VSRVREVTADNKIILDVPAGEVKGAGGKEPLGEAAPGAGSNVGEPREGGERRLGAPEGRVR